MSLTGILKRQDYSSGLLQVGVYLAVCSSFEIFKGLSSIKNSYIILLLTL